VVTADMTQELVLSGADIVKVGIGPGSVCTTRIQTGVGYPQLSAVIECADAAHGLGSHIIADGGCTCPGDVAKGFGAGADFIMLGGMLAGHDEGKGKIVKSNGEKYIEFYGSSSDIANNKHYGGLSNYRSSEGRTVRVKYRGKVKDTILNILGGLRSSCTYVGAPSLKQLSKCTTFVRVARQFNDTFAK
jgi:GMP reductase